ncbi:MAG: tRNA (N6-threonylcarbamoyladenosine(37)-N6)-methyltransferase TrmO [Nitrososphaerales archaeon]
MEEVKFYPIGVVRRSASDDQVRNREKDLESTIDILPEFEDGLEGLHGFSHILVLGFLNRLRPEQVGPLKVKPKGLLREGFTLDELPLVGVFALDSPTRPNPIGLALVNLLKIEKNKLIVSGLDFFDGTPILDIKPYQNSYRADGYTLPPWHLKLLERAGHV